MNDFRNGVLAIGTFLGVVLSLSIYLILGDKFIRSALDPSVIIPSLIGFGSVVSALGIYLHQRKADIFRTAEGIRATIIPVSTVCLKVAEQIVMNAHKHASGEHDLHAILLLSDEFQSLPRLNLNSSEVVKVMDFVDQKTFGEIIALEYKLDTARIVLTKLIEARDQIKLNYFGGPHPGVRGSFEASPEGIEGANLEAHRFDEQVSYLLSILGHICDVTGEINSSIMAKTRPNAPLRMVTTATPPTTS